MHQQAARHGRLTNAALATPVNKILGIFRLWLTSANTLILQYFLP
jgi:hypothetical protein